MVPLPLLIYDIKECIHFVRSQMQRKSVLFAALQLPVDNPVMAHPGEWRKGISLSLKCSKAHF